MSLHGVGYSDAYNSAWDTVDTVNQYPKLCFSYPTSHEKQKQIASHFFTKSSIGIYNYAGYIGGLLIWTSKPTKHVLEEARLGCKKFFCGKKKTFWIEHAGSMWSQAQIS